MVTGIILAGGASRRMGRDKALLEIDGEALLARTVHILARTVAEVIVVGPLDRPVSLPGTRMVPDEYPGAGPLGGIATGLRAATSSNAFVCACDMPFLNPDLIRYLLQLAVHGDAEAVVPNPAGRPEPLHAVYARSVLPVIETQPLADDRDRSVHALLELLSVRWVDEDELRRFDPELQSFANVNTPADWEAMRR